jgi:beta-phosphoglucomutase
MASDVRAVIFDLDGVITDTAEFHYQGWQRLANELGVPFDRHANEQLRGLSRMDSLLAIVAGSGLTYTDADLKEWTERKNGYYLELVKTISPNDILPGAKEILLECRSAGIKTAIASASKNAPEVLERLGLGPLFDAVAHGGMVARGKPDPEIFACAANLLGIPVENCVGVEDSAAGLESIIGAGMASIGLGDPKLLARADRIFTSLKDVRLEDVREVFRSKRR